MDDKAKKDDFETAREIAALLEGFNAEERTRWNGVDNSRMIYEP